MFFLWSDARITIRIVANMHQLRVDESDLRSSPRLWLSNIGDINHLPNCLFVFTCHHRRKSLTKNDVGVDALFL